MHGETVKNIWLIFWFCYWKLFLIVFIYKIYLTSLLFKWHMDYLKLKNYQFILLNIWVWDRWYRKQNGRNLYIFLPVIQIGKEARGSRYCEIDSAAEDPSSMHRSNNLCYCRALITGGKRERSDADGQSRRHFQFECLQTGFRNVDLDVDGREGTLGSTQVVSRAIQPDGHEHLLAAWADRSTTSSVRSRIAPTLLIIGSNFWRSDSNVTWMWLAVTKNRPVNFNVSPCIFQFNNW